MAKGNYSSTGDFKGKRGPNAADGQLTRSDKAGKAFSELSTADQRKRAEAARSAASENVFKSKTGSPEAKKHFKAEAAANRVLRRLGSAPGSEGKKKATAANTQGRRAPIVKKTTKKTQKGLDAVAQAARAGRG